MRLLGLTGGIATGKSTVAAMLAGRGAIVVDADTIAHEILLPGGAAFDEVVGHFGGGVLDEGGTIDRAALGAVVFADPEQRVALERITHPAINAVLQQRIVDAVASSAPLVVADIPLLFERDGESAFEGTMLVYARPATQLLRIRQRDSLDDTSAQRRLVAQLPIDEKRARATWVIDNEGTREATAAQVDEWWGGVVEAR